MESTNINKQPASSTPQIPFNIGTEMKRWALWTRLSKGTHAPRKWIKVSPRSSQLPVCISSPTGLKYYQYTHSTRDSKLRLICFDLMLRVIRVCLFAPESLFNECLCCAGTYSRCLGTAVTYCPPMGRPAGVPGGSGGWWSWAIALSIKAVK